MEKVEKETDLNRRKFMEIGIYTITGTIAAVSSVALARFAVGPSFNKEKSRESDCSNFCVYSRTGLAKKLLTRK